jgi:branched-chain amino acid transport system substrate-binding protein
MRAADEVDPFLVGVLDEGLTPEADAFAEAFLRPIRLRFDEALAAGEVDRPIEIVVERGRGLPAGTAKAVEDAWLRLHAGGALLVLGPGITDNCLAVTPLFERHGLATLNFPGTTDTRGEYGFHYQLGALYEDGPLAARAIAAAGMREVAVIRDRSPIGREFFDYFAEQCEAAEISITADLRCSPVATDLTAEVEHARSAKPDALVYLGFGGVLVALARALRAADWEPPRFTTSAGMHWYSSSPQDREVLSGWVYVDMVHEENQVLARLDKTYRERFGESAFTPLVGAFYDMATLAVLALRRATVHTREGVKEGLERIHHIPSALGGPGTVMGFGPWERTALKGENYLVLRRMDGDTTTLYEP